MSEAVEEVIVKTRPREETRTRRQPPYHVILENDDHHTFEFVIDVLRKALSLGQEQAVLFTTQAHRTGRAIVWTGVREVAELKMEQIQTFHEILPNGVKLGPLGVSVEPAPG